MKKLSFFIVMKLILLSSGYANVQLCVPGEGGWLDSWRTATSTLPGSTWESCCAFTQGTQSGTWSVGSTHGGAGAQSVTGISQCSTSAGGTATGNVACPGASGQRCRPRPASADGRYCWCRMTSPAVGGSWVFLDSNSSAATCATHCALSCASSVQGSASFRAAVLAVP